MLFQFIIKILFRKDVESMAVIYATLIIKGKKTFADAMSNQPNHKKKGGYLHEKDN